MPIYGDNKMSQKTHGTFNDYWDSLDNGTIILVALPDRGEDGQYIQQYINFVEVIDFKFSADKAKKYTLPRVINSVNDELMEVFFNSVDKKLPQGDLVNYAQVIKAKNGRLYEIA
jgi:hypothetical protein